MSKGEMDTEQRSLLQNPELNNPGQQVQLPASGQVIKQSTIKRRKV